jgi:membrane associated rhomboid family serine protease
MKHAPGLNGQITKLLVFANVAVFALEAILGPSFTGQISTIFGLSSTGLANGWWWQLVTHQFLHGNSVHLFVNMLMLWFVGRDMEDVLGQIAFLGLYIGGGIAGGLCQLPFLAPGGVLIGASGSVCAVLLALTTMFPKVSVTALLFFVLPVRLKAGLLGIVVVAGSILLWVSGLAPSIGHAAHLGGFAFGIFYAFAARLIFAGKRHTSINSISNDWNTEMDLPPASTRDEAVEKLLRHGLESLSKAEVRLLESPTQRGGSRWH